MEDCLAILRDLVRSIAESPEQVEVTYLLESPLAFRVQVAQRDYAGVLSKLGSIKTLAACFAGLPEGTTPILHLTTAEPSGR
jgi:predicted RNA-binding protein YlqC (UPF0109 family)